jgi:trans-aconitate methyltransferase
MSEYATIFDEYPYPGLPIPATYPPQLALSSRIHGGPYPPSERFRLLELGCGDGGNLLPLAFYHPDCEFVGFDYAPTALKAARATAQTCRLTNVRFVRGSFTDETVGLGVGYDFVLAHGVFSWISDRERSRVLDIARSSLGPAGLACISYNVQPAWALRGQVRDLLTKAVANVSKPALRVERAKRIARELRDRLNESDHPYQVLMAREFERVASSQDYYVYHEFLCEHNRAYRIDDFAALAAERGLRYLCDASFNKPEGRVPQPLAETLSHCGFDGLDLEQFADALGYRLFRTSVLCRADADRQSAELPSVDELAVASVLSPANERPDLGPGVAEEFCGPEGERILCSDPVIKTMFVRLNGQWPWPLAATDLISAVRRSLPQIETDRDDLSEQLLGLHRDGLVLLSPAGSARRSATAGETPHALATLEAARNHFATTPFHTLYGLRELDRELIRLLAKHGSAAAASAALVRQVETGTIVLDQIDNGALGSSARRAVDVRLARMREWGLISSH